MFSLRVFLMFVLIKDITRGYGARILFHMPTPTYSHNAAYHTIIKEMIRRGHDVVSISTHPMDLEKEGLNATQIDVSFSVKEWKATFDGGSADKTSRQILNIYSELMNKISDMQLGHPEVTALIQNKSEHFDLIVVESIKYHPIYGWSYRFKAPMIGLVSLDALYDIHDMIGNPAHPYLYQTYILDFLPGPEVSFWQRMKSLYHNIIVRFDRYMYIYYDDNRYAKKHFGENVPTVYELENNFSLIIVNQNEMFNPRAKVPTYLYMDMMHIRPTQPLPQELHNFLEESSEGVVYFSLGSNVQSSSLPKEILAIFIEVFSNLPVKVLWKFEKEELIGRPDNVMLCKWCPQQDILAHRNVKLFIMQGGLQSIEEGIHYKVPIIGIPMIVDQTYNLQMLISRGAAEMIKFDQLNKRDLSDLISRMLSETSYKMRMREICELFEDQLTKPLDRVVWWLEYVLRHGGAAHLRTPQLPWYLTLMLDAVSLVLIILFVATCLICRLSKLARKHTGAFLSTGKLKAH